MKYLTLLVACALGIFLIHSLSHSANASSYSVQSSAYQINAAPGAPIDGEIARTTYGTDTGLLWRVGGKDVIYFEGPTYDQRVATWSQWSFFKPDSLRLIALNTQSDSPNIKWIAKADDGTTIRYPEWLAKVEILDTAGKSRFTILKRPYGADQQPALALPDTIQPDEVAVLLQTNINGIIALSQVYLGPPDSGGVGFRSLRVRN